MVGIRMKSYDTSKAQYLVPNQCSIKMVAFMDVKMKLEKICKGLVQYLALNSALQASSIIKLLSSTHLYQLFLHN